MLYSDYLKNWKEIIRFNYSEYFDWLLRLLNVEKCRIRCNINNVTNMEFGALNEYKFELIINTFDKGLQLCWILLLLSSCDLYKIMYGLISYAKLLK